MLTTADLEAALDEADVVHREVEGTLHIDLGVERDLVPHLVIEVDDDVGVLTAAMGTAPFLVPRERDEAQRWFAHHGLGHGLHPEVRAEPGEGSSVWLHQAASPSNGRAARAWLQRFFDEGRELLRAFDRSHLLGRPDMADLATAMGHRGDGQLDSAIARVERGLRRLPAGAPARVRGMHLVLLGEMLYEADRRDEASPHLDEGLPLLAENGDAPMATHTGLLILQADVRRGDLDLDRCDQVVAAANRFGTHNDRGRAEAHRAKMLMALGRVDEARDALLDLEARLAQPWWGDPGRLLGDVRLLLALALASRHDTDGAASYLDAAERVYADCGASDGVARCRAARHQDMTGTSVTGDGFTDLQAGVAGWFDRDAGSDGEGMPPATRDRDRGLGGAGGKLADEQLPVAGSALVRRAMAAISGGDLDLGFQLLEEATDLVSRPGFAKLEPEVALARRSLALLQLTAAQMVAGSEDPAAVGRLQATVENLHAETLEALRMVDVAPRLASVASRERWAVMLGFALLSAFCTSMATGRPRLAHVLLDRALAQGLPDLDATAALPAAEPAGAADSTDDPFAPAARRDELDSEARMLAAVRASLHDLAVTVPVPVDVTAHTRLVGGPEAWRWTLWRAGGLIAWSVHRPDGQVEVGVARLEGLTVPRHLVPPDLPSDDYAGLLADDLGPRLADLRRAQGVAAQLGEPVDVVRDLLMEDPEGREPATAWAIGRALLPPVLRRELCRRADEGEPLRLVVAASPSLLHLPYGLLAIRPPSDATPLGTRLVEAAVVTIAPPAVLVDEMAGRAAASPPLPVRVAVVDPTADLPYSAAVLDGALSPNLDRAVVFDGDSSRQEAAGRRAPTKAGVVEALCKLSPGEPGVLLWGGHADAGSSAEPLAAGLRIERASPGRPAERLTVSDIILDRLPVPSRAVVFGCATTGAGRESASDSPNDMSEWWGVPVALLYAGARCVLATAWDLIDCPATASVAAEVLALAAHAPDPAAALREVQLRRLHTWSIRCAEDRTFTGAPTDTHPHLWGAWLAITLHTP